MAKLIIDSVKCRIDEEKDVNLLWALDKELSYNVQGAHHTRAFKVGFFDPVEGAMVSWDGKQKLFNEKDLSFSHGLKDRVIEIYKKFNKEITIIDNREPKTAGRSMDILPMLKDMGKVPRQYQLDAMLATRKNDLGIIRIPTGGGKCNNVDSLNITEKGILTYSELLGNQILKPQQALECNINISTRLIEGNKDLASLIYNDGKSESIKITTNYGFTETATPDHKIKVKDNNNDLVWKKFKDLEIGDKVAISLNNQMFGKESLNYEESYFYGLLFNSGVFTGKNKFFIHAKGAIKDDIYSIFKSKYNELKEDSILKNQKFLNKLKSVGIYDCNYGYKTRGIPEFFRRLDKNSLSAFMRGLFESGSTVCGNQIVFGSFSIKLVEHIQIILLNFGILSKIKEKRIGEYDLFYDLIIESNYIGNFNDQIGFSPDSNNEKLIKSKKTFLFSSQELFFDCINSLSKVMSENYDFVVPNSHSFTSQGFINHNTLVATLITADIGKTTIVYVIGKDLLHQLHGFFKTVFKDHKIGKIGDGFCEIGDINVVSIWSIGQVFGLNKSNILTEGGETEEKIEPESYSKIRELLKSAKVHILDECHVAACNTIQTIIRNIKPEHLYGMSASPWRDDGADLLIEATLGHKIIDVSASDLISNGWLIKPYIKFIEVPRYEGVLNRNYQTIYKNYIVENDFRNAMVVKAAEKMVEGGYKPLVLFNSINHGKILHEMISKKMNCTLLSGKDDMALRETAKDDIDSGKLQVLIASRIFDIGVDVPSLSGLVVAGSGKSSVRALQRIGRVIRPAPGKKRAVIADFLDNAEFLKKHSIARREIYETEKGFEIIWPEE
jgi:superfamily II DNA or RNA helicase